MLLHHPRASGRMEKKLQSHPPLGGGNNPVGLPKVALLPFLSGDQQPATTSSGLGCLSGSTAPFFFVRLGCGGDAPATVDGVCSRGAPETEKERACSCLRIQGALGISGAARHSRIKDTASSAVAVILAATCSRAPSHPRNPSRGGVFVGGKKRSPALGWKVSSKTLSQVLVLIEQRSWSTPCSL
ncbi:hypothetical protein NDU88_003971 [Pleurodeles waltl]|uniref:Uncharacterized protein n=1 Tax=Pleurodeles waltl TaxID=8319 RepID=A0AAV7VHH5_PLEWA|nr:hypothetical protein NDU88_003971 [Pleurodeles waltl]